MSTIKSIQLDLPGALANLRRQKLPTRVFHFEHGVETPVKQALCDRFDLLAGVRSSDPHVHLIRDIRVNQFIGSEFLRAFPGGIVWPGLPASAQAPPPAVGPIQSWRDYEGYSWPKIEDVDWSDLAWYEKNLPDHLAMWVMTYLFQMISNLFGFEPMCLMLYEDRDLVRAVVEKVGTFYLNYVARLCQFSRLGAINVGDDMGHKTGTLVRPDDLRELFFPWHKKIVTQVKRSGKFAIFHTCGQVRDIMDDLIDDVGIDAKHSTQDVVEPVTETYTRYGRRVGILGGIDIDFVIRATPDEVRAYTRNILNHCQAAGGFALGLGNWVELAVPLDNYLAMLETARGYT